MTETRRDDDPRVFRLMIPSSCPVGSSATEDDEEDINISPTSTSDDDTSQPKIRVLEISAQQQQKRSKATSAGGAVGDNNNNNNTDAATAAGDDNNSSDTASSTGGGGEYKSLLAEATTVEGESAICWSLTTPYWNVESDILLQVTFRPAWQALPEYTKCGASCCSGGGGGRGSSSSGSRSSSCSSLLLSCARCACTCGGADRIDWYQDTFTVQDIVRVERQQVEITGFRGVCQAVRVHLRPLLLPHDVDHFSRVPPNLQDSWDIHLQRMMQHNVSGSGGGAGSASPGVAGPVLTFCVPSSVADPPVLWKVEFPCPLHHDIALETLTVFQGRVLPQRSSPAASHIYIHGYESWSFTGSVCKGRDQPTSALPAVFSKAFNYGGSPPPAVATAVLPQRHTMSPQQKESRQQYLRRTTPMAVKYQSDFFTCLTADVAAPDSHTTQSERRFPYQLLDERGGPACVMGWLSQRQQFGVVTADVDLKRFVMHCSCHGQVMASANGNAVTTDWAYAQIVSPHSYDEEPMVEYLHAVAAFNHARPLQNGSLLTGWCSWYHYYENISAANLRENFANLAGLRKKVPTNVSIVDDGYMTAWGDWDSLKPYQFPSPAGLAEVSNDIASHGMRPGLWLAPYSADKHSKVVKNNPSWVIRNESGAPANSSFCGKFFYGLDASNPDVRAHVHASIQRAVRDWKFNVLKIDFLYAAVLHGNGKYDLSLSRAQTMDIALHTIRKAAGPDVFLIGCGCPIGSGIGYVDGMRVSADTGPTWVPAFPLPHWDHGTLPSLRSMIKNTISRAPLGHRWWHNDPDCLLLGESTKLTDEEVASAATVVAMTCGMMLLSDDLTKVSTRRMKILTKIFPMIGATAVVLDLHSTNAGLPSLLRLWCTDSQVLFSSFHENRSPNANGDDHDHNAEATFFARESSFKPNEMPPPHNERKRSCLHVAKGLGTWLVVSISNWSDKADVVDIPPAALHLPPSTSPEWSPDSSDSFLDPTTEEITGEHGCHVFAFWSSKYSWLPEQQRCLEQGGDRIISKRLLAHETEIFHVKPVTPDVPQYVGSDLHFSCGREVRLFRYSKNEIYLNLKTDVSRVGHVFLYIPRANTDSVRVTVNGQPGRWNVIGSTPKVNENGTPRLVGRIIRIKVVVRANQQPHDGEVKLEF